MAERILTYECDDGIVRTEPSPSPCEYDDLGFVKGKVPPAMAPWQQVAGRGMREEGMSHADQRLMLAKEAMAVFLQDELNHMGEKINERRIAFKAVQMADRVLAQLAIPAGQKDA